MPETIYIGKEYKEAFINICKLKECGCIPDDVVRYAKLPDKGNGGCIKTETYTFEISENTASADDGKSKNVFTSKGASWFASLRGETYSNGLADWISLIDKVADCYHKQYAFTEFKQTYVPIKDKEQGIKNIKRVIYTFYKDQLFKDENDITVIQAGEKESNENIYCASLRIDLSNGSGAAVPVLAKVYFRAEEFHRGGDNDTKMVPIPASDAEQIDVFLQEAFCDSSDITGGEADSNISVTIDLMVNALDTLLKDSNNGFGNCVCFSSEKDKTLVKNMISQGAHVGLHLECTSVNLLGMSHVCWVNSAFMVSAGEGRPLFRAVLSLNETISLYCENCGGILIKNNVITVKNDNGTDNIRINPLKENLGLTESQIKEIIDSQILSLHHRQPCSGIIPRINKKCERRLCGSDVLNAVNIGTKENPEFKCKNCPYPEVVYWDGYSKRYNPRTLVYAYDLMRPIEKEFTDTCRCCHKTFSKEELQMGKCSFCRGAVSLHGDEKLKAKKLYASYSHVFSPFFRMINVGREKLCFERYDIILFVIGNKKYKFDKRQLEKYGYLRRPERID